MHWQHCSREPLNQEADIQHHCPDIPVPNQCVPVALLETISHLPAHPVSYALSLIHPFKVALQIALHSICCNQPFIILPCSIATLTEMHRVPVASLFLLCAYPVQKPCERTL
jgi:hypothetical protein